MDEFLVNFILTVMFSDDSEPVNMLVSKYTIIGSMKEI